MELPEEIRQRRDDLNKLHMFKLSWPGFSMDIALSHAQANFKVKVAYWGLEESLV